jgi:hypothetical protein
LLQINPGTATAKAINSSNTPAKILLRMAPGPWRILARIFTAVTLQHQLPIRLLDQMNVTRVTRSRVWNGRKPLISLFRQTSWQSIQINSIFIPRKECCLTSFSFDDGPERIVTNDLDFSRAHCNEVCTLAPA